MKEEDAEELKLVEEKAKMRLRSSEEGHHSTNGSRNDSAIAKTGSDRTESYDDQTAATAVIYGDGQEMVDPYSGDVRKAIPVDDNYSDHSYFSSDDSSDDSNGSDEETKLDGMMNTDIKMMKKRREVSNLKAKYNPLKALKSGRDLESYQQNKLLLHKEAKMAPQTDAKMV